MIRQATTTCPGCGARVPDVEGPVHAYVPSAPGCWAAFGEAQADELTRFGYPPAHRIVVDAYMAQHPGDGTDRRNRQSVLAHLVGLCAVLEEGWAPGRAGTLLGLIAAWPEHPALARTGGPGRLTVLHLRGARDLPDYEGRAHEWASAVWDSWAAHHGAVRAALAAVRPQSR